MWEVLLILVVLLLVFGARRLPEIGAALGKGIREFKGSVREIESEINRPADRPDLPRSERTEAPAARPESQTAQAPPREEPAHREVETTRPEQEPRTSE